MNQVYIRSRDGRPLSRLIDGIQPASITSFVGGGGKTSSMLTMGMELASMEQRVIMTTTTKIRPFSQTLPQGLRCIGRMDPQGKLRPVDAPDQLKADCDYLLIEADGSRGLPLKAPASHEPVITEQTGLVIAVVGMWSWGRPIYDVGHRVEQICHILQKSPEELVTEEDIVRLLLSEEGLRKGVAARRYAVILNQVDGPAEEEAALRMAAMLPEEIPCLITSYRRRDF